MVSTPCYKTLIMKIPNNISEEIRNDILKSGGCGDVEFVESADLFYSTEQDSDLSFCEKEYIFFEGNDTSPNTDINVGYGTMYYPYETGYLKCDYVL